MIKVCLDRPNNDMLGELGRTREQNKGRAGRYHLGG